MDNGLAICLGVLIGTLVLWLASPLQTVGVALGLVAGMAAIIKVEWGLLFLVFITHNNMSTVLIEQYGAPSIASPVSGIVGQSFYVYCARYSRA